MVEGQRVQVITDSTADIPEEMASALGIWTVPLTVSFGAETYADRIELSPPQFYEKMAASKELPKTSAPAPGLFHEYYAKAIAAGRQVVSIHLSNKFSGTVAAARVAASEFESGLVTVIDSYQASMGCGFLVLEAAEMARAGADHQQIVDHINALLPRVAIYVLLDSLENLRRGGRIGKASALLGTMLSVKPIITVTNGEASPVEKVRLLNRAISRLVGIALENAPFRRLAVAYSDDRQIAEQVAGMLAERLPGVEPLIYQAGPVIGTYVGRGAVATIFVREH